MGLSDDVRGAGSKLATAGMQNLEGSVLKALGLSSASKPDGSASNPVYVRMAGSIPGGGTPGSNGGGSTIMGALNAGSRLSSLGNIFHGVSKVPAMLDPVAGDDPLGLNKPAAIDTSSDFETDDASDIFQGFFAPSGPVVANRPAIIGEEPGEFIPKTAGTIIPNDKLAAWAAATRTTTHGTLMRAGRATRQMIKAQVQRGIYEAIPTISAYTDAQRVERNKRLPASRRN